MLQILFVGLIALAGAAGLTGYLAGPSKPRTPPAPPAIAVSTVPASQGTCRFSCRIGAVQALNTVQLRSAWTARSTRSTSRKASRSAGRRACDHRPAAFPGGARPGEGEAGAGPGATRQRSKRPRTRPVAFAAEIRVPAIGRPAHGEGWGGPRAYPGGRSDDQTAETNLSYTTITAPFPGRIGFRAVDPGNIVRANDTSFIATITQQAPIAVVFTLPEAQLAAVRAAQTAGEVPVIA